MFARLVDLLDGLMEVAQFAFFLLGGQRVGQGFVAAHFGAEFPVALPARFREGTGGEGLLNGAGVFDGVTAIAKAAGGGERGDFVEDLVERLLAGPELELAHAGGIDERAAFGEEDELAVGGGVAAAAIGFADFGGAEMLLAGEGN